MDVIPSIVREGEWSSNGCSAGLESTRQNAAMLQDQPIQPAGAVKRGPICTPAVSRELARTGGQVSVDCASITKASEDRPPYPQPLTWEEGSERGSYASSPTTVTVKCGSGEKRGMQQVRIRGSFVNFEVLQANMVPLSAYRFRIRPEERQANTVVVTGTLA